MDKFVRASEQIVTPTDDSKLYNHIFGTGLFNIPTLTYSGSNIHVTSFDGIVQGHDFHFDEQDVSAALGSSSTASTFYLYADFNLNSSPILSLRTASSMPSYSDDMNGSGTHQVIQIGSYTATSTAVASVSAVSTLSIPTASLAARVKAAESDISTINSSLTPSYKDVNPGFGLLRFRKSGHIVTVTYQAQGETTSGVITTSVYVPELYRPKEIVTFLVANTGDLTNIGIIALGNDGTIRANIKNAWSYGGISYIV